MAANNPPPLPVDLEDDPTLRATEEFFLWNLCGAIKATKRGGGGNPVVEMGSGPADLVFGPCVGGEGVGVCFFFFFFFFFVWLWESFF